MQYFGVPTCPYCKKRVNLIRTWSLKKQGEYQCPRCGGISNIYLSPLIYVFALLAVFAGGAMYFFHKFVLDDITLTTGVQVLIPFAIFFLISLFQVYLAKPVIKKVPRSQVDNRRKPAGNFEDRRLAGATGQINRVFTDTDEYLPPEDYRTGAMPAVNNSYVPSEPVYTQPAYSPEEYYDPAPQSYGPEELQKTAVIDVPSVTEPVYTQPKTPAAPVRKAPVPTPVAVEPPTKRAAPAAPAAPARTQRPAARRGGSPAADAPTRRRTVAEEPVKTSRVISSVEIPSTGDDFFAKYDDPEYIERRLRELQEEKNRQS